jgi:outer membrane protein assembly factor BamB
MCTPVIEDGYIYGVCSYGQLRCLKAPSGERVWETFAATTGEVGQVRWANAFIVQQADRYFLFNEGGDLMIARLSPAGYQEISRSHLLEPTNKDPGRPVVWSQPAFADRCIFARNDREIVCASLAQ